MSDLPATERSEDAGSLHAAALQTSASILALQRRAQQEQAQTVALLTAVLGSMSEGLVAVDENGAITAINPQAVAMLALPPGLVARARWVEVQAHVARLAYPAAGAESAPGPALHTRQDAVDEIDMADGRVLECQTRTQQIDGVPRGTVVVFRDVTARMANERALKQAQTATTHRLQETEQARQVLLSALEDQQQAEAALRESETRFRTSFDAPGIGMSLSGLDGRWLQVNPRLCEIVGYTAAELLRMSFRQIVHPDDLAADLVNRQTLLDGSAQFFQMEKRYVHRDGHPVWVHLTLSIVRDAAGAATHFVAHVEDISARKALEEALQRSQARLTATLEAIPDLLFELDLDGRYLDYHSPHTELLAAPPEVLLGQLLTTVLPADAAASMMAGLQEAHLTGSSHGQQKVLDLPVGRRWFEMSMARKATPAGERPRFIVLSRDITERKQAEAALRESEERYRQIVQTAGEGIWTTDADACTTFVNPRMAEMLGYTVDQMIGRPLSDFLDQAGRAAAPQMLTRQRQGLAEQVDLKFLRQDGAVVWCLLATNPVFGPDGTFQGTLAMVTDITARQQAQASLEASLRDKEALLKEVHHRVKNNLQVIHSLLRLETGRNELPATQAVLRAMQGRIQSMALLHESLYRSGTFAAVDLGAYLRQLATQAFRSGQSGSDVVRLELALATVQVGMDQAIPCGLLVNELISNCLKHAFPDGRGGAVRVELQVLGDGAELRLCVSDTGVGLPADFEARRAQSLGLQLVADLAAQLGGRLDIAPLPQAAFSVTFRPDALPRAAESA